MGATNERGYAIVSGFIGRGRGQRFVTANYDSCTCPFSSCEKVTVQLPPFYSTVATIDRLSMISRPSNPSFDDFQLVAW